MKSKTLSLYILLSGISSISSGQTNEFKIGMFDSKFKQHDVNGCNVSYDTPLDENGNKTSTLNVLVEDGFNIWQTYQPNEWITEEDLKHQILLTDAHGLKIELGAMHFYKPLLNSNGEYAGYGINVYDNCGNQIPPCENPWGNFYFRPHYDNFLHNVYTQSPYKDIIWGYHIDEEGSFFHYHHFIDDCHGNDWGNPLYFLKIEVPPINVHNALNYYKSSLSTAGINNHKMVIMEANHHKSIMPVTNDGEGIYNPEDYLQLLRKEDPRDVFFEGSYAQFPDNEWENESYNAIFATGPYNNSHYLGKFRSIDYARTKANEVHSVIATGTSDSKHESVTSYYDPNDNLGYIFHYHSDPTIQNANWLWFQAYTSIIHGVDGVWFWGLDAWNIFDASNLEYMENEENADRFDRQYFPYYYKNYTANLAKELRMLVNKNIITTDKRSVVATKTDQADGNCILPPAASYIPSSLPNEKQNEHYGLRYTIRTNGNETYMIITNPLNESVGVKLSFSTCADPIIQSSTGVTVLFDDNQEQVFSENYKTDRNSGINLTSNTCSKRYNINYTGTKELFMQFGPLDVKVLKFISSPPDFNNDWQLVWTNYGSGQINGHHVRDGDKFYTGDFDGDNSEELLCVSSTGSWINMLKYVNNNWEWMWSNYGSTSGLNPYRYNLVVGDYDGDGKDELLGNDKSPGGWTTLFKYDSGDWQWAWSDYGNASHAMRAYKAMLCAGDFDGDGKDQIFGANAQSNGWITTFKWNGSDFVWDWSNYGNSHPLHPYRLNVRAGDYDGDGKDELLGLNTWATVFHFDNGDWNWGWSTNGSSSFGGWTYIYPLMDLMLIGNLDSDNKDEIFMLQTSSLAHYATTFDFNAQGQLSWNWSANDDYTVPYIDNWPLAAGQGENTRYLLIKAKANEPEYLMAMRQFCSNYLVSMYKPTGTGNYRIENENTDETGSISLTPNPSHGFFTIISKSAAISHIDIFNSMGQLIHTSNYIEHEKASVDLTGQPNGIYLVKSIDMNGSISYNRIILSN